MSFDPDQILQAVNSYEKQATANEKLDPKAEVRNRGDVCVSAEHAKDHQDHYPIGNENQARNALARVHQYSSVPPWYNGSLKGLQNLVSRKVHSKYPGIGKEKKSSVEGLINKYSQTLMPHNHSKSSLQPVAPTGNDDPEGAGTETRQAPSANKPRDHYPPIPVQVQQKLVELGYNLGKSGPAQNGVDGQWGPATNAAIEQFKAKNNLAGIQNGDASIFTPILNGTTLPKQAPGQYLPSANPTSQTQSTSPEANAVLNAISQARQWSETFSAGGATPQQMIQVSQNLKQLATQLWNSQGSAGKALYDQATQMAQSIWTQVDGKSKAMPAHKHHQQPKQNQPVRQPTASIENLIAKYAQQVSS